MKQHILIVDDEPPIRELLKAYFKKRGYQVSTASTAPEAVQMIAETPFDLIVLDVLLADYDGLELLTQIKETHPDLPVIIMTGIGSDEELIQEAAQKGAAGYVSKTMPLDQLLGQVQQTLAPK